MPNNPQQPTGSRPFTIPWVNITIERRIDVLTLLAFLLALSTAGYQACIFFRGAQISLIPPEQVLLNFVKTDDPGDNRKFLNIVARMAYVNSAQQGYDAVLRKESVEFVLDGVKYIQRWHSEQKITDLDNNGVLEIEHVDEARPRPINGGSALSREVVFAPFPEWCANDCDRDKNFLFKSDALPKILKQESITFIFSYELFGESKPESAQCVVDIDNRVKDDLKKRDWTSPLCRRQ